MKEAIYYFSGKRVTAHEASKAVDRRKRRPSFPLFTCPNPSCGSIVFLRRRSDGPHFYHRPHFGRGCPLAVDGEWNEESDTVSISLHEQIVKELLAALSASRAHRRIIARIEAFPVEWMTMLMAKALMGNQAIRERSVARSAGGSLNRNAVAVLYHPYFALLLRWSIALILERVGSDIQTMSPEELALETQDMLLRSEVLERLRQTILGESVCQSSSGLRPMTRSGNVALVCSRRAKGHLILGDEEQSIELLEVAAPRATLTIHASSMLTLRAALYDGGSNRMMVEDLSISPGVPLQIHLEQPSSLIIEPALKRSVDRVPLLYACTKPLPNRRREGEGNRDGLLGKILRFVRGWFD